MDGSIDRNRRRRSVIAGACASLLLLASAPGNAAGYYLEEFDDGQAQSWSLPSGWSVSGAPDTGLFLQGNTAARTHALYTGNTWHTGFAYTVRMNSPTWATATPVPQVGMVFNRQDANNYYEAMFNEDGVTLHRVLNGSRTTLASGAFPSFTGLPNNRYTDMQVVRIGTNVTVRVNGLRAIDHELQAAQVFEGRIGVAVWNNTGHFDYAVVTNASNPVGPDFPRIGTLRIGQHNYTQQSVQEEIARAHVALLHYDTAWEAGSPGTMNDVVQAIKNINSATKVILYTKANEANFENMNEDTTEPAVHAQIEARNWWVRDSQGAPVPPSYKPHLFALVNMTRHAPVDPATGLRWSRWYAKWTHENYYVPNPLVDGLYMDNVNWKPPLTATPSNPAKVADWDRDGAGDPGTRADVQAWFRQGFRDYFDEIGARLPGSKFKFANLARWGQTTPADNSSLAEYYGAVHGGPIESLLIFGDPASPETWGGWARMMETYRKTMSALVGQRMGMFVHELPAPNSYQHMRYGLASCLMDDGYYSPYVDATNFTTTPMFDEYDADLGQATSKPPNAPWQDGVWRRDFENGIALVNPKDNGPQTVTLETTFVRLDGDQAPSVNNGQPVTTLTLQDRDGIILLRQ